MKVIGYTTSIILVMISMKVIGYTTSIILGTTQLAGGKEPMVLVDSVCGQSLDNVSLPSSLQQLTFDDHGSASDLHSFMC